MSEHQCRLLDIFYWNNNYESSAHIQRGRTLAGQWLNRYWN